MATITESTAVFDAKLKDLGLDGYQAEMNRRGWSTLSTFAFASSWAPGSGDDGAFITQVVTPILGRADHPDLPKLRKLYHEAYTVVAAELRQRLEGTQEPDGSKTRKLPAVERKTRWAHLRAAYGHLHINDQLEPAHHVVDRFHSMKVDGELKYMAPHEIPTRDQELQNIKTEELIKRDASGHFRAHDEAKMPDADTRTDLRLRQAYTRRGLALEVADVMTYTVHEKLVDKLFQEYQREPPMRYNQVTLGQLTAADRRAWKLMSEEIQGDLGRNPAGRRLADVALEKVIAEPAFVTLLLPLPGNRSSNAKEVNKEGPAVEQESTGAGKRKLMKENQKLKERLKEAEAKKKKQEVYQYEEDRSAAPKKMPIKMPKELWGLTPMKQGERICYGYNMTTCKAKDGKCGKGLHICMRCWKSGHAAVNCPGQ